MNTNQLTDAPIMRDIPNALNALNHTIVHLEDIVGALESRLAPALLSRLNTEKTAEKAAAKNISSIGESIEECADRIGRLHSFIGSMLDALQL